MPNDKHRILIVEDAVGVARMYKQLLSSEYDVEVCHSGLEAQAVIDLGTKFDLVIMDIVLPPEDMKKYSLDECQRTGLRLMEAMIGKNICSRFYVITVLKDLKEKVEAICRDARAVLQFVYKLDSEPEELVDNIKSLLAQQVG